LVGKREGGRNVNVGSDVGTSASKKNKKVGREEKEGIRQNVQNPVLPTKILPSSRGGVLVKNTIGG